MKKYLTPREAYIDYMAGEIPDNPLNEHGQLIAAYDGNEYVKWTRKSESFCFQVH